MTFLERYLANKDQYKPPGSRYAIEYDRWDRRAIERISKEVQEYRQAEGDLGDFVDTGIEAMNDTLLALFKITPELREDRDMKPKFRVNHQIIEEMMGLGEYAKQRPLSEGDPIGAGLAAATMEPELEVLFDKLKQAQELAQKAQDAADAMAQAMEQDEQSIEELMQAMQDAESEEEAQDYQDQAEQIAEHLEALRQAMEEAGNELDEELEAQSGQIQLSMRGALQQAQESVDAVDKFEKGWGLQPGSIRRTDPQKRMELSRLLRTEKFRRLADMIGKMQNIALTEQMNRSDYATDEIYDLEQGADLARVVPTELLALSDDVLVYEWLHRYVERNLVQYALHGEEKVNRGGIIFLEDGSSSMSGTPEIWAKAVGGALLKLAITQKRPFYAVNFSGVNSYISFDFDLTKDYFTMKKTYGRNVQEFAGAEAVIDFYSSAIGGGTCFMTPLSIALDRIRAEFDATGAVKADVVFVTDGQAGVPRSFLDELAKEKERLGFKIYGIAIGSSVSSEPLNEICDGFVVSLRSLTNPKDVGPIFQQIGR